MHPPGTAPTPRHEARERALSLLYEAEQRALEIPELLAALPVPADTFAAELAAGVGDHTAVLDEVLARHAHHWRLERMALLDRTILRMAAYELAHHPDVPTAVIIDEAVELAKTYSTEESPRFVNGVLSAVAAELRPGQAGPS